MDEFEDFLSREKWKAAKKLAFWIVVLVATSILSIIGMALIFNAVAASIK